MNRREFIGRLGAAALASPLPSGSFGRPGKVSLDLWGWQTTPFYQRRGGGRVLPPEELARRAIDESWKWGANLVEIYRGGYPLERRAGWTRRSTAALHRHIHERDMAVQWFPHRLDAGAEAAPDVISHVPQDEDPSNTFAGAIAAVRALGEQFDALNVSPEELIDGLGSEQWPVMPPPLFDRCMWPYNPGMYFYTDNHAFDETLPNEIDVSASNGSGSDDRTSGYYQLREEIRKRHGLQFWGSQAECRTGIPDNGFGGLGHPDWVLKQANDQFRARARTPGRNLSPSALWWINEAEDVCPEENRRYVYGISQDPVRCAVTARFTVLGQGGLRVAGRGIPSRYPYPARTAFIQNNCLRALVAHDRDASAVFADPERLAHYDADSRAVCICEAFGQTVLLPEQSPAPAHKLRCEHVEPAGYRAVLKTTLGLPGVEETRTLTALNDSPYLLLDIERIVSGPTRALASLFGFSGYDRVLPVKGGPVPALFRFEDSSSRHPYVALMVLDRGTLTGFRWRPREGLILESAPAAKGRFRLALVLTGDRYRPADLVALRSFLAAPEEQVQLGTDGRARVRNPFDIPVVKVVRVAGAGPEPYQVRESGRWVFRGAQPSLLHAGEDYVKCCLPPKGSAVIQRYGFVEGAVRPARGCQYSMDLRDCRPGSRRCSVTAEVGEITSFVFAPGLRFSRPVAEVRLNGRPWRYFDRAVVYLPNRRGNYRVEVAHGDTSAPHLARTFACVDAVAWRDERLTCNATLPEWVEGIPSDFHFTAMIRHPGRSVTEVSGCEVVRAGSAATIIRFLPGRLSLSIPRACSGQAVAPIDFDDDVEQHLSRLSSAMLAPYLAPFRSERVRLQVLEHDASVIDGFDAIVWNYYFLDELPARLSPKVLDVIRRRVAGGAGALLMANAVRALPMLAGRGTGEFHTSHLGHHLNAYCESFGIEPSEAGHPVFRGMHTGKAGGDLPLLAPASYDIFKRVLWRGGDGRVLGVMAMRFLEGKSRSGAAYERSPVLREWPLGAGRLLAFDLGPRCSLGSPDRWTPSDNLQTLFRNMVGYVAPGTRELRVAILE